MESKIGKNLRPNRRRKKDKILFRKMKKLTIFLLFILTLTACQSESGLKSIDTNDENVAIEGFDTVAYFAEGAAKGKPEFEFVWNGAKWLFSNNENLEKFTRNPEQYVPQFGGYCAFSASQGRIVKSDPKISKVVGDKIYLFNNQQAKEKWEADQAKLIETGQKNWEQLNGFTSSRLAVQLVDWGLIFSAIYLILGVVFALYFVIFQIGKFDETAKNSGFFFRLIIFFGATVFWIFLLLWMFKKKERVERTSHRI